MLAACVGSPPPEPTIEPCGVIKNSLGNVHATTVEGEKKIDENFERGVAAGCWSRDEAKVPDFSPSRIKKPEPLKRTVEPEVPVLPSPVPPPPKKHWWQS